MTKHHGLGIVEFLANIDEISSLLKRGYSQTLIYNKDEFKSIREQIGYKQFTVYVKRYNLKTGSAVKPKAHTPKAQHKTTESEESEYNPIPNKDELV